MISSPTLQHTEKKSLLLIEPNSGETDIDKEPEDVVAFNKVLHSLKSRVSETALKHLQSNELNEGGAAYYVQKTFLSKHQFKKLERDTQSLARKVILFIKQDTHSFQLSESLQKVQKMDYLCLPQESMSELRSITEKLKKSSTTSWNRLILDQVPSTDRTTVVDPKSILEEHANFYSFVYKFNSELGKREKHKHTAFSMLNSLRHVAWKNSNGVRIIPDISKIRWVRKALFFLYQCQDSDIKERALRDLIDLLESDPIHMDTANDLVDLQEKLLREIQPKKAQNLNIKLQRLLIKAYATTLECILIHANSSHLNGLEEEMKLNLWDSADSLEGFNIKEDEEISLWAQYAIQGAQRIKTEVPEWKKWVPRIIAIGNAIIQIGKLIEEPEKAFSVVADTVNELSEAFSHFERHREWFEELMALRKITRLSLLNIKAFRKVTNLFQLKKKEDANEHVLYGAVSTLEHSVMNSPCRFIQEEAIKLLIQYITLDNVTIQSRIVQAFTEMLSGPESLRNTSFVVLRLLEETHYIPNEEIWQEVRKSPLFVELLKDNTTEFKNSLVKNIHHSVIKFVIRRIGDIKGEKDCGGHSFTTLICSSTNDEVVTPLLKCLSGLSPEFSKPDVRGNSLFHLSILQRNIRMIRHAYAAMGGVINAKDYSDRNTPLHLAAISKYHEGVELLLSLRADPNIVNAEGATPLHLAVKAGSNGITELLLHNNAEKNNLNILGETALNIAIKKDNVYLTDILMQKGAKIAGHVNQITPITFAARNGSEQTLIHLLENKDDTLTRLEALEITKMISRDGESICATEGFCRYHLEKIANDHTYAAAFKPYRNLPRIDFDSSNQLTLHNPRQYSIAQFSPFKSEKMSFKRVKRRKRRRVLKAVDDFGNTELILLAKSANKTEEFKKLLARIRKVNRSNFFGLTVLHVAVICGNEAAVKELVKLKRIDIHARDIRGFNVLHFAAFMRNTSMLKLLLDCHADPNAKNGYGDTPFLIYCGNYSKRSPESLWSITTKPKLVIPQGDSVEALDYLLDNGAAYDHKDSLGNNALHHAVCNGRDSILAYLLKKYPDLMWESNKKGLLPIQEAVIKKRQLDLSALLKGKSLMTLHSEFLSHTNNRFTLGNLLALTNQEQNIEKLLKSNRSLASHQDSTPFKNTPLHTAAKRGRPKIIEVYRKLKLDLTMRDGFGNTPIHIASLKEQLKFLKAMIESGVNLVLKNQDGRTPLHLAATRNKVKSVKLLSKFPVLVREKDGNGDLPLHLACKFRREGAVNILCEAYEEGIYELDDDLNTPLHHACYSGNVNIVKSLVKRGATVEAQNIFGERPLSIASLYGHTEVVQYLTSIGANISAQDLDMETALHKAVYGQHLSIVDTLLEADKRLIRPPESALVHITDVDSETPLHELPKVDNNNVFQIGYQQAIMMSLLRNGADVTRINARGETFLHVVCFYGQEDLLRCCLNYLKERGNKKTVMVNDIDKKGNTLLHKAAAGNRVEVTKYLITLNAIRGKKNAEGETPFFTAVKMGHYKLAAILHQHGSPISARDKRKRTILHALFDQEEVDGKTINFLKWIIKEFPSLLYLKDDQKRTPLHIVAERNHHHVVDLILEHLPGNQEKNERYLWKRTTSGQTSQQIAMNNHFYELEMKLRTYPKNKLGNGAQESLETVSFSAF